MVRMKRKTSVLIKCSSCAYEWETKSDLRFVTCPSCYHKIQNPKFAKEQVSMEHFNLDENGVRVLDPNIHWIVDVDFKPNKAWCSYCESENCNHVKFALGLSVVQDILRKKGWKINE